MAFKHTVIVSGLDITDSIGGYVTDRTPVYSDSVVTMDGVEHKVLIRTKSRLAVTLNPRSLGDVAALCDALEHQPVDVSFYDQQNGMQRTASMVCDFPTATLIRGMTHLGQRWVELGELIFEEL